MWLVPLALAYGAYAFGGSAYAERYTGISLPPFLLLAGLGIGLLPSRATVTGLLALISVLGLIGGRSLNGDERTNAAEVATRIAQQARPGDVVGYCPDQLGPAVHRMLVRDRVTGIHEVAFADASGPALVDWVDYAKRMEHASATDFAQPARSAGRPRRLDLPGARRRLPHARRRLLRGVRPARGARARPGRSGRPAARCSNRRQLVRFSTKR